METRPRREGSETDEHPPLKTDGYPVPGDGPEADVGEPLRLTEGSETDEHDPVKTGYPVHGD
jgi:hypothetical protein